jgi:hypothetical protein
MTTAYDTQVGGDHYKGMAIQPMQFSMANGLDACTHTAIKYLVRKKGGKAKRAEDLRKAIHCIQLLAQHEGLELGEAVQSAAVPYIGPDRRACGDELADMVRAGKSVLPEDTGACGNVGSEA